MRLKKLERLVDIFAESDVEGFEISKFFLFDVKFLRYEKLSLQQKIVEGEINDASSKDRLKNPEKYVKLALKDMKKMSIPIGSFYFNSFEEKKAKFKKLKKIKKGREIQKGREIKKGDVIGYLESSKMMQEVVSKCDGVVEEVYIENGASVDYISSLFEIKLKT